MAKNIKLGIIGISEGNGHPYSWSAICNGYNAELMADCPFAGIPKYLGEQGWPEAQIKEVSVTHIWTQSKAESEKIAEASLIGKIVERPEEMIGEVDGVLLARDDAENHEQHAKIFLEAGIPIYIDKPLALSKKQATALLRLQEYDAQVFSCSALRYAKEIMLTSAEKVELGKILRIEAATPKSWGKYAVHIIEPVIAFFPQRGRLISTEKLNDPYRSLHVKWDNLEAVFSATGNDPSAIEFEYFGESGSLKKTFSDSFNAFKLGISAFIKALKSKEIVIDRSETMEIVELIEHGR